MKKTLLLLTSLLAAASLHAQQMRVDDISVEARAAFHQETREGVYDSHFQGDYLNLNLRGQLSDGISFRLRQRLNKKIEDTNPFNATDFLWLRWQMAPKWSFTFGKQPILVGGYEFDAAPIDVYYYSAFCDNLHQYYAFGASLAWHPAPKQSITFQFIPSPISPATQNSYSYNLHWAGEILPKWQTLWSVNLVEDIYHRKMNYIAMGNRFPLGALVLDLDLMNRASFQQKRFLSDWTAIVKAIWTVGKWNICTKFGYEQNDAANVDENGVSYDLVLPAGNNYLYGGAGVEYFPLGNEDLRIHVAYFRDNHDNVNNFDIGVTWRFHIYKR